MHFNLILEHAVSILNNKTENRVCIYGYYTSTFEIKFQVTF